MEKTVTIHRSFEEADRAEKEYYRTLTPSQRLDILLELNKRWPTNPNAEPDQRLARVYRITELA
jgi:hypothetical protein